MPTTLRFMLPAVALLLVLVGCQTATNPAAESSIGRYHLTQDQRFLYITDTSTGHVWYRGMRPNEAWDDLGTPVPTTKP